MIRFCIYCTVGFCRCWIDYINKGGGGGGVYIGVTFFFLSNPYPVLGELPIYINTSIQKHLNSHALEISL